VDSLLDLVIRGKNGLSSIASKGTCERHRASTFEVSWLIRIGDLNLSSKAERSARRRGLRALLSNEERRLPNTRKRPRARWRPDLTVNSENQKTQKVHNTLTQAVEETSESSLDWGYTVKCELNREPGRIPDKGVEVGKLARTQHPAYDPLTTKSQSRHFLRLVGGPQYSGFKGGGIAL